MRQSPTATTAAVKPLINQTDTDMPNMSGRELRLSMHASATSHGCAMGTGC